MAGHFVFVRFFLDYHESFPFKVFNQLKDDEIGPAIEALREEWWSDQANRRLFETSRIELEESIRKWNQAALARPGKNGCLPWAVASDVEKPQAKPTGIPSFEEIAVEAGWGHPADSGGLLHGISHRYPVERFDTKETADDAAAALQERVSELARSAQAKNRLNDDDVWLVSANPRFVVVAGGKLSGSELATTREKLRRIRGPVTGNESLEESLLRFFMPRIQGTLEQIHAAANGDQDEEQTDVLSQLQYDILDALRTLKATDPVKRQTGPKIAIKVGGEATDQSVKAPLADLKRRRFVDSQTGRNGGTWLTSKGLNLINTSRPKQ